MTTKSIRKKFTSRRIFYITAVAWPMVQFLIFYLYVNFNSIVLSMQEFDYFEGKKFAGFSNFQQVFTDFIEKPYMLQALKNTLSVFLIGLVLMPLPIVLAYYLFKKYPLSGVFKVFLFLPNVISSMALILCYKYFVELAIPEIWKLVFNENITGLLTNIETKWGTLLFYNFWIGIGGSFLLYLGAMSGISEAIFDAAKIDGVNPVQEFLFVVFPMIYPTFTTFFVTSFATLFTNQVNIYTFFGDSAEYAEYTMGYILYAKVRAAGLSEYPYYAAMGLILTMVAMPLCFGTRKLLMTVGPKTD